MVASGCSTLATVVTAILVLVHIAVWTFILFAFVDERAARFNVTVAIPLVYLAHCSPFHALTASKQRACGDWMQIDDGIVDALVLPRMFKRAQQYAMERCFQSPISPQGMLVFGALTSAWRVLYSAGLIGR